MGEAQTLYNIPAGQSFVDVLARGIKSEAGDDPLSLASVHILLPTRRACRSLREAFLRLSDKPILLPRMSPMGDVDEDELSLLLSGTEEEFSLPPSCPPLRRKFLLAQLIRAQGYSRGIEQDLSLADALGQLMDQVYTEDLDLKDLEGLVDPALFSEHWQISLKFLSLLSEHWPLILKAQGLMDAADRRNRLIKSLAAHWKKNPPAHKIIAAGSTGSIPATAELLKVVAGLPLGCVVLPGLDLLMDGQSWNQLDDIHPQATLRNLLQETFKADRKDVQPWPYIEDEAQINQQRRLFASEIMRPAATAQEWQTIGDRLTLDDRAMTIERYDCAGAQEEALVIALAMRRALQEPGKRAALVTPDRGLARRVAIACRRWGIEIDDSGGDPLSNTPAGSYMRLCLRAACADMKPVALLDFCKHSLCAPPDRENWRGDIRQIDKTILRGPAFRTGFSDYKQRIQNWRKPNEVEGADATLSFLERAFAPLSSLLKDHAPHTLQEWCEAHLSAAENFCAPDFLWGREDGEATALFFSNLMLESDLLPPLTGQDYLRLLEQSLKEITVRPRYGLHPRLVILGQIESRLIETDVMILSGLNENSWPPKISPDPWMSRPMRKKFGLPPLERSVGLSAHDFVQGFCAKEVVLTRSLRTDGTPTVPSRWLKRMETVLHALGKDGQVFCDGALLGIARQMDRADKIVPLERPEPRPPLSARPRRLSVTKIDKWMGDPYSIYAGSILKLAPLPPLEQPLDAALRGTLIHDVLDQFVARYPDKIPPDAGQNFVVIAKQEMEKLGIDSATQLLWEPRLEKTGEWLEDKESLWRQTHIPAAMESEGTMTLAAPGGLFTLSGKADRIDLSRDGTEAAILDYKTGGSYSRPRMIHGDLPQLPLEALILESGGFAHVKAVAVTELAYWVLNGAGEGGKEYLLQSGQDITTAKQNADEGLRALIDRFDDPRTPYYSLPRTSRAPKYNDYEHLARVREWTALDESEEGAA